MKVNRRKTLGILAGAGSVLQIGTAQTPAPAQTDSALNSAREGFRDDMRRIAAVKLPQATEPAFRFQA